MKKVKAQGKAWEFQWIPENYFDAELRKTDRGVCDSPDEQKKRLRIREGLPEKLLLDTACHEFLHASLWMADEAFVNRFGTELAKFLWDLGFRRDVDKSAY